jgi:hypothetical protein
MKKSFLILGGLFATLIIVVLIILITSNWKTCSRAYYVADQNGNRLPTDTYDNLLEPNPCDRTGICQSITTTKIPELRCLINPFPGGF